MTDFRDRRCFSLVRQGGGRGRAFWMLLLAVPLWAGAPPQSPGDLAESSLETLMNMEVSSPSRKDQKLSQTAGAVYVITQEDIRRSGVSSIPELLRMVPGVQVARIDANCWSVTARGFAGRFSDKMLVLIDGRSIYNHLFAGVYWEQNNVPLEDIERIEVIRGPGATMWGSNAVNGVINIITKPAAETQGVTVTTGAGNEERESGSVRYGGATGNVAYRASAEYFDDGPFSNAAGQTANDGWKSGQMDGRLDWQISSKDSLTVEADAFRGGAEQSIYPNYPAISLTPSEPNSVAMSGAYLLGKWTHQFSDQSDFAMQLSFSDQDRTEDFGTLDSRTTEFDFQHHLALSSRNDFMWGFGFEIYEDDTAPGANLPGPNAFVRFVPADSTEMLGSLFAQDEFALLPGRLSIIAGVKVEDANYFGADVQPSARLLWSLTPSQDLWASVSRAVRTPSLADRDTLIEFQPTQNPDIAGILSGNPNIGSEHELTYEAGYRNQPVHWLTLDLATFFSIYHDLRTIDVGEPYIEAGPSPVLMVPLEFGANAAGHTYGIEMATNWSVAKRWRLTANYSWFRYGLDRADLTAESIPWDVEGSSPAHQVQFRSQLDPGRKINFDTAVYYVSALTGLAVPAYVRTDARISWRVSRSVELSLAGQNLLNGSHFEFATTDYVQCTEIGRTAAAKVTWSF